MNIDFGGARTVAKVDPAVQANWTIMDIKVGSDIVYDFNSHQPFPLADNSVDAYYCSMVLEHVCIRNVRFVLSEFYRTLVPGAFIRIVVPDIERGMKWYLEDSPALRHKNTPGTPHPEDYPRTRLGMLLPWFYTVAEPRGTPLSGHQMAYDWESMYNYLDYAGFKKINRFGCGGCSPVFRGKDLQRYSDWALYVEGKKPRQEMRA